MTFDLILVPFRETVPETVVDRRTGREWTVDVEPFLVAPTVVTVGQWSEMAGAGVAGAVHDVEPSLPKVDVSWRGAIRFCNRASEREGLAPVYTIAQRAGDGRPAPSWTPHDEPAADDWVVSRREGADGYRLLTDAEWQIACRAGVRRKTNPSSAFDDLGFRLARSLPPS